MDLIGRTIGRYAILAELGRGGMGVVYRARDTRLNREVAFKVLPPDLVADPERRRRFVQEAQTASQLDHPNIAVIHEIDDADGMSYIVMELIRGEGLSDRLARGSLPPSRALALAVEIAGALARAHEAGIVHRDLKPANIMIREDGHAKIIDFGLAKLYAPASDQETAAGTAVGAVVGTAAYMSPEQARGEPIDQRSDLFSFGIVLHQMLSGIAPFQGRDTIDVLHRLLHDAAPSLPPLAPAPPDASAALQRIVAKCLEKDRSRRYQSARDLVVDLRAAGDALSVASAPVARRPGRRVSPLIWGLAAVAIAVGALVAWLVFRPAASPLVASSEFVPVTDVSDLAVSPVLSPDGRMVAFLRGGTWFLGSGEVYVKLLPNGEPKRLTTDPRSKYSLAFSPDGARIAYTVFDSIGSWETWTVPSLGGPATRLLPNAAGLTWIDAGHVLFSELRGGLHMGLVTAREDRSDARTIYFPPHERAMAHLSYLSPDRRSVLVVQMNGVGDFERCQLVAFDGQSPAREIGPDGRCVGTGWSPDGRWMYFTVRSGGSSHLWRQRYPSGTPEPITAGSATDEEGVAVAPDGRSIVTSVGRSRRSVWIHDAAGARLVPVEGSAQQPLFSRDGKSVFCLVRQPTQERASGIASVDLASGKSETLFSEFAVVDFVLSPDGGAIALTAITDAGERQVWLAALDRRSPPKMLVRNGDQPRFASASQIVFRALDGHVNYVDHVAIDGTGRARIIPDPIISIQSVSPTGRWIVATLPRKEAGLPSGVMRIPFGGGRPEPLCAGLCEVSWSPDGRFLYALAPVIGRRVAIPLAPGQEFVDPLTTGRDLLAWTKLPGAAVTDQTIAAPGVDDVYQMMAAPGPDPSTYLFIRVDETRNLFRVPLR